MKVGLLITCLIDLWRPKVGFAAVKLIEAAGGDVHVPAQTCCGQPAYNSGDRVTAQALARQMIDTMAGFDAVVVPSGSCAGMVAAHYPELLADDPAYGPKAKALAAKTFELTDFLTRNAAPSAAAPTFTGTITHHHSCSCLREMNVRDQPLTLLSKVDSATIREAGSIESCCGFGGTFAVKYPDISAAMAAKKADDLAATGADMITASDMGCLMNIAGTLQRQGRSIEVRHIAEVLADMMDAPAIGAPKP
jgi:L-lactate dehydrogenase complex protein LldE